jgi:endonuclease/exonuclease/phosphatase family metal-dependent hydrolase
LDSVVTFEGSEPWRLTCIYGEAKTAERFKTWDMMKYIKSATDLSWMCIGDFNEVLHQHEHMGTQQRSNSQMAGFREALDICGLADLGFVGKNWTFEKRVVGGSFCRIRLDRAVASPEWIIRYPEAVLHHLTAVCSDH